MARARRSPVSVPFRIPPPAPEPEATRILEIKLPPCDKETILTVECVGPEEAVTALRVRAFEYLD